MTKILIDSLKYNEAELIKFVTLIKVSLMDPIGLHRVNSVEKLRRDYYPEIRKVEVIEDMVRIKTLDSQSKSRPYRICKLPDAYLGANYNLYPWNMDEDKDMAKVRIF